MTPEVSVMPLPVSTPSHRGNLYPDLYHWRLIAYFLPVKGKQPASSPSVSGFFFYLIRGCA